MLRWLNENRGEIESCEKQRNLRVFWVAFSGGNSGGLSEWFVGINMAIYSHC